jgi:hypothetical protein
MTPQQFCQLAMSDYERQWAAAAGHQERHPLRVKMELLKQLTEQAPEGDRFTQHLEDGCDSENPLMVLLCNELSPWWQRVRTPAPTR